jgi:hypothetical protein
MTSEIPATGGREILSSTTINQNDGWWVGVVRDRDPRTGTIRIRLERLRNDARAGWKVIHHWRVRPEYWEAECDAVSRFQRGAGTTTPPMTPVHDEVDVLRYLPVRKDEHRWVAVVKVTRPYGSPCTRLYHWEVPSGSLRQKWTICGQWERIRDAATRQQKVDA